MTKSELNIAVEAMNNLHEHEDHCIYDTEHKTLVQFCNVCRFKELKNCTSYRIIEILDIED